MSAEANASSRPMPRVHAWMRWARFACFGAILCGAGYVIARFDTVHLAASDDTARPFYDPASSLLIDTWDPLGEHGRHHVAFHLAGEGGFRIGRIVARAGQLLDVRASEAASELFVDGAASGFKLRAFDEPAKCRGRVPEDHVFVVSLVPGSEVPDSRIMGPFRRGQLAGRVLLQLPW